MNASSVRNKYVIALLAVVFIGVIYFILIPQLWAAPNPYYGTINGSVIGTYCDGAMRAGAAAACTKKEPLTSLGLTFKNASGAVQKVTTNKAGKFSVMLEPGKYTVNRTVKNVNLIGDPFTVSVSPSSIQTVTFTFKELRP